MDTSQWLIFATGGCAIAGATWLGARWWYGRQLDALNLRLQKVDKARQFSSQQTLQARRQVEALQKDLAAQNEVLAKAQLATQRSRHLEEALRIASATESSASTLPQGPAHSFADTQPMA
jgi:hypothetical protein